MERFLEMFHGREQVLPDLCAKTVGDMAMAALPALNPEEMAKAIEGDAEKKAMELISKIPSVLDDETLDGPECFQRIEALVNAFHEAGIYTSRHDF